MENFCCRHCGSINYREARVWGDASLEIARDNGGWSLMYRLYVCDGCSTVFANIEKFSLTSQQQNERQEILKNIKEFAEPQASAFLSEEEKEAITDVWAVPDKDFTKPSVSPQQTELS